MKEKKHIWKKRVMSVALSTVILTNLVPASCYAADSESSLLEGIGIWFCDRGNDVKNGASFASDWIVTTAGNAWNVTSSAASGAGEWIGGWAGDVYVAACDATDAAGKWIGNRADDAVAFLHTAGDWTSDRIDDLTETEAFKYGSQSLEKIALGDYSDKEHTVLSFAGNAAASFLNVDLGMDIRDMVYDIQHYGNEDVKLSGAALDAVALLPIIGCLKPLKQLDDVVNSTKIISNAIDYGSDAADIAKDVSKAADAADTAKDLAKAADIVDDITDIEGTITVKALKDIPEDVQEMYHRYADDGWKGVLKDATPSTHGGLTFRNDDNDLPNFDKIGNPLTYKEYDVFFSDSEKTRGLNRFVRSSDGKVYFTDDHYETFTLISETIKE